MGRGPIPVFQVVVMDLHEFGYDCRLLQVALPSHKRRKKVQRKEPFSLPRFRCEGNASDLRQPENFGMRFAGPFVAKVIQVLIYFGALDT